MVHLISISENISSPQRISHRYQRRTARELREAARNVEASLPAVVDELVAIQWAYIPSGTPGGNGFGYGEVAPGKFPIFLLDVWSISALTR